MGLKEDRTVPSREERLGACNAYGATSCSLGLAGKGCGQGGNRSFSQAGLCQLLPTLGMLLTLRGSAVIVHGALGCGSSGLPMNLGMRLQHLARGDATTQDSLWFSTNLTESEVVHGGEQKLEQTLVEVWKTFRPQSIIVLSTCTPAIIGDDIQSVVDRVRPSIEAPILVAGCPGFKTGIWATGYDVAFHAIVHGFIEDDSEGPPPRRAKSRAPARPLINLISLASVGKPDEDEITRLLRELDIDVLVGPNFGDREIVRRMTEADLTVSICPTHDDYFVRYLETEYGIPSVLRDMPIGLANTRRWILDIAKTFDRQARAEQLIAREEARAREAVVAFRATLAGKRVFVSAGEFRALVTASLFQELGLEVVGLRSYHHDEFGVEFYGKLVEAQGGRDFPVDIANFQPFELVNLLRRTKPDLFAGHVFDNVWAAREGIPSVTIFRVFDCYLGYRGFYEVARKTVRVLQNPAYNRTLARNVKSAYRQTWFEQNPFHYIRSSGRTSEEVVSS